jgi:hypothetical protein
MEVSSITDKSSLTLRHFEGDIEVSMSITSTVTLASHLDTHTVFDTRRDIDIFFYARVLVFLSMTSSAFLYYLLTTSATDMTSTCLLHHAEDGLDTLAYLSASMTSFTFLRCATFCVTGLTRHTTLIINFSRISSQGIFERYAHADLDIFTYIRSLTSSSSETTSEKLRKNIS